MHLLRLADDKTEIRLERSDRAGAAGRVPRVLGHGALNQVDEWLEVLLSAADGWRTERDGRRRAGHGRAAAAELQLRQ